jgi:hypothetical protein
MSFNEKCVSFSPDDRYLAVVHCSEESDENTLAVELYEVIGFMLKTEEVKERSGRFINILSPVCSMSDGTTEEIDESANYCGLIRKDRDPCMGINMLTIKVLNKTKRIKVIYTNWSRN